MSIVYFIFFLLKSFSSQINLIYLFLFQHSDYFTTNCKWKISKRKQQTLWYFEFTKKIVYHGKQQQVKIPNFIDAEEAIKLISCLHCPKT